MNRKSHIAAQQAALKEAARAWKPGDHPELAQGATAWVQGLRALDDLRFEELERWRTRQDNVASK